MLIMGFEMININFDCGYLSINGSAMHVINRTHKAERARKEKVGCYLALLSQDRQVRMGTK